MNKFLSDNNINDDAEDCAALSSDTIDTENFTEPVKYFELSMHPKAVQIKETFNINKRTEDCTIADNLYFEDLYPTIEYYLFFDSTPVSYRFYYTVINSTIRSYILYRLTLDNIISLHAFKSSASLSPFTLDSTTEVLIPTTGEFVISFTTEQGKDISLILLLDPTSPTSVTWIIYAKTGEDFADFDQLIKKYFDKYNPYTGKVFTSTGNFVDVSDTNLVDIYLDENVRSTLQTDVIEYIEGPSVEIKKKNGLPIKRGVVFAGEPGTGKTFTSRALANELSTTFMIVSSITGASEIDSIFNFAKQFKSMVILFEDIDIYIKGRDSDGSTLSMLLNRLDGVEQNTHLVVICTTNKVEVLDKALKDRPGRIDRTLTFSAPSAKLKQAMLEGYCTKNISSINFEKVVTHIPLNYTGAHLKEIYITACNLAIKKGLIDSNQLVKLTTQIFIQAINSIKNRKELKRIGFGGDNS